MDTKDQLLALFEKGWTQQAISDATGIPQGTVSRMASGNDPRASNARLINQLYEREISLGSNQQAA